MLPCSYTLELEEELEKKNKMIDNLNARLDQLQYALAQAQTSANIPGALPSAVHANDRTGHLTNELHQQDLAPSPANPPIISNGVTTTFVAIPMTGSAGDYANSNTSSPLRGAGRSRLRARRRGWIDMCDCFTVRCLFFTQCVNHVLVIAFPRESVSLVFFSLLLTYTCTWCIIFIYFLHSLHYFDQSIQCAHIHPWIC